MLEFLEAVPKVLEKMAEEQRQQVERKMGPLHAMLQDFRECVRSFGKKGFLKRAMGMSKHGKTLAKLDKQITVLLESTTRIFDLEIKDRMLGLLQERVYPLGAEVTRRVDEHVLREGGSEEDAAAALVKDPNVVHGVAVAALMPTETFRTEIGEFRVEMGERFDETQKLIKGYGMMIELVAAKQDEQLTNQSEMKQMMVLMMQQMQERQSAPVPFSYIFTNGVWTGPRR